MFIRLSDLTKCTESEIRAAFPNTSFASPFVPPDEYAVVFQSPTPTYNTITQGFRETTPTEINGKWYQAWEVFDLPAETVAANQAAAEKALQEGIVQQTQKRLDDFAKTRNYDGILSLCTYASSAVPKFQAEGQYGVNVRDNTWATLYQVLADVQAGTRPVPTGFTDVEPLLPTLEWPV